jgi:hypothetical protein
MSEPSLKEIIAELASGASIVAHDNGSYELCYPGKPITGHTLQWVLARDGWVQSTANCGAYVLTDAGRLAYMRSTDEMGSGELIAPNASASSTAGVPSSDSTVKSLPPTNKSKTP